MKVEDATLTFPYNFYIVSRLSRVNIIPNCLHNLDAISFFPMNCNALTDSVFLAIERMTGHLTLQWTQSIGKRTPGQSGRRTVPFHMRQLVEMAHALVGLRVEGRHN